MKILPAIDLLEGCAVRLRGGRREDKTVYSTNPIEMIDRWVAGGAERIHVVDLDGAFAGGAARQSLVAELISRADVEVQVGGGLRDEAAIRACLESGAAAAVVGTAAIENPEAVAAVCRDYPDRVIVAVDARDGIVSTRGWTQAAELTAIELAAKAADWGAASVLYTDIARDGLETGANVSATAALFEAVGDRIEVIASGGVSTLDDIRALIPSGAASVVVGRALYEKNFTLAEAIATAAPTLNKT